MFSGLSSLHRGQSTSGRRQVNPVIDLGQVSKGSPTGAGSKTSPGFRASESSSVSWHDKGQGAGSGAPAASPRFNDPVNSDVRIEVANAKGEIQNVLDLHSQVLREQSDYFCNTLGKRGQLRETSCTTFTIHTSRYVPDPEIYVTVFRLFYQEEELIAEDILCMGSVWKVLLILVVAAEFQFHSCTTACVDFLESVPWSDQELEDIVHLVPQLERLQDAQPVLDRLPVRTWDEDSISGALRMLLVRAVAFHDGMATAAVPPGLAGHGRGAIELTSAQTNGAERGKGAGFISAATERPQSGTHGDHDVATRESGVPSQNAASHRGLPRSISEPVGNAAQAGAIQSLPNLLKVHPSPGTLECRDAACSILRNHQGPLLPLRTKQMLLRETFKHLLQDLLQGLWSEQKQRYGQKYREREGKREEKGEERPKEGTGEKDEGDAKGEDGKQKVESDLLAEETAGKGRDGVAGGRLGVEGVGLAAVARASSTEASVPFQILESVYGKQGALTWITDVMIEFSMADEVFKWLASDKDFLAQVLAIYRKPGHATDTSAAQLHTQHAAQEAWGTDAGTPSPLSTHLWIVRSSLLGLAAAVVSRRLVVNPKLRSTFVRTWVPVLAEICTTGKSGQALIYGFPLTEEQKAIILSGYNELVLTLPAADQPNIFQLWFLELGFNAPMSTQVAEPHPQGARNTTSRQEDGAERKAQIGESANEEELSAAEAVAPLFWFTLSPAYIRWLKRLGKPCGAPREDY